MNFMSAREAAAKWGISQRRVAFLCSKNRIDNATMVGNMWVIPVSAEKPIDARSLKNNKHTEKEFNPLKHFKITIEETVSGVFDVYAVDDKEAFEIAKRHYSDEKFVLAPGNLVGTQMCIYDVDKDSSTEWMEV